MTRLDVTVIGSAIAIAFLGGLLLLYPRISVEQTAVDARAAIAVRTEILRVVTDTRSDLVATQASLADLAQLMRNSEHAMNSQRLARIETCVCP